MVYSEQNDQIQLSEISHLGPSRCPQTSSSFQVKSYPLDFSLSFTRFVELWDWLFSGLIGSETTFVVFPNYDPSNGLEVQHESYVSTNANLKPFPLSHLASNRIHCAVFRSDHECSREKLVPSENSSLNSFLNGFSDLISFRDTKFDIDVTFVYSPSSLTLRWDCQRFSSEIADYIFKMIRHNGKNESLPLSVLNTDPIDYVGSKDFNERTGNSDHYLHGCFYRNVLSNPNQEALNFVYSHNDTSSNFTSFTFQELHSFALTISKSIPFQNKVVPIMIPHSPSLFVAILAVLFSSNAYCPIDVETNSDRVQFICKDTSASLAIAEPSLAERFPNSVELLQFSNQSLHNLNRVHSSPSISFNSSPDSIAYVLYTSGSTGTPKGVPITHRSAVNSIYSHSFLYPKFGISRGDRWLQFANVTFDVSVYEIFGNWNMGLSLVTSTRQNLVGCLEFLIHDFGIAALELTPTVANVISVEENFPLLKNVRMLLSIGELLTKRVIDFWDDRLVNAYGPTEAAIHVTLNPSKKYTSVYLVGTPLAAAMLCICNTKSDTPSYPILEDGFLGEVCIAGPQLSRGYLNREELNAKAFTTAFDRNGRSFSIYRTGDCGRIINGRLYIYGRISGDMQVKIRGRRVELGEIESKLAPAAQSLAVEKIDERLVAFFVGNETDVKNQAEVNLQAWMRPTDYVSVETLPYLPSGKMNRKALKAQFSTQPAKEENSTLANQSEEITATVVKDHYYHKFHEYPKVNRFTSIFELGYDSLDAVQLSRAFFKLGYKVSLSKLLSSHIIESIAKELLPITSYNDKDTIQTESRICTDLQKGMLYESLIKNGKVYVNHDVLKIDASVIDLEKAWCQVLESHSLLRSSFHLDDKEGFIRHINQGASPRRVHSEHPFTQAQKHYENFRFTEEFLRSGPLDVLISHNSNECCLSIIWHHALYDGWSLDVIKQQLDLLLKKQSLPNYSQFDEYVHELRLTKQQTMKETVPFWKEYLKDFKLTSFKQHSLSFSSVWEATKLKALHIDDFCKSLRITPLALLLTAWSTVISKHTESLDTLIGTVISGRMNNSIENIDYIVGPCMRTLPVRIKLSEQHSYQQNCKRTLSSLTSILDYTSISLADIQEFYGNSVQLNSLLILQQSALSLSDDHVTSVSSTNNTEYPLLVEVDKNEHYQLKIMGKFEGEYLKMLMHDFQNSINKIIMHADALFTFHRASSNLDNSTHNVNVLDNFDDVYENEDLIRSSVSKLLNTSLHSVDRFENLQLYGLDSLMLLRVFSDLRKRGIQNLNYSQIGSYPSISTLCRMVQAGKPSSNKRKKPLVFYNSEELHDSLKCNPNIEDIFPCSPMQQALLTSTEKNGMHFYYNKFLFDIGDQSFPIVLEIFEKLTRAFPILRTCFYLTSSSKYPYCQVVLANSNFAYEEASYLDNCLASYDVKPVPVVDSGKVPLRLQYLHGSETNYLLVYMHHVLYDAWSFKIIFQKLTKLFRGEELPLSLSMRPYIEYLSLINDEEKMVTWKRIYNDFQPIHFPCGMTSDKKQSYVQRMPLDYLKLRDLCSHNSVTTSSFLQVCWARTLSLITSSNDVCFGNVVSGRNIPVDGVDSLAGPTFNSVPLRVSFSDDYNQFKPMQQLELLKKLTKNLELNSSIDVSKLLGFSPKTPMFDTIFIIQNGSLDADFGNWKLVEEELQMDFHYMLELYPDEEDQYLSVMATADCRVVQHVCDLFMNIVNFYLDESIKDTLGSYLRSKNLLSVHEAEDIIESQPSTTLQISMSYADLDFLSNRWADWLVAKGLTPNNTVVSYMEKSFDHYCVMLACIKLGVNFSPVSTSLSYNKFCKYVRNMNADFFISDMAIDSNDAVRLSVFDFRSQLSFRSNAHLPTVSNYNMRFLFPIEDTEMNAISIDHRLLLQAILDFSGAIKVDERCLWLQFASNSNTMQLFDCFAVWMKGATLVTASQDTLTTNFSHIIERHNVTHLNLNSLSASKLTENESQSVKLLISYGGKLSPKVMEQWNGRHVRVYQPKNINFPCFVNMDFSNNNWDILGKMIGCFNGLVVYPGTNNIVPKCGFGQLCLAVKAGLFNMPNLNNSVHQVNREYSNICTDVIVRLLPESSFQLKGLIQVNESNKWEDLILQNIPEVRQAYSILTKMQSSITFLMVNTKTENLKDLKDQFNHLFSNHLFEHLPNILVLLEDIPLDSNERVDEHALFEMYEKGQFIDKLYLSDLLQKSNTSSFDNAVISLFSKFFKLPFEAIKMESEVSTLGLDSLSAIQLSRIIRKQYRAKISALDLLESFTLSDLSQKLQSSIERLQPNEDNEMVNRLFMDIKEKTKPYLHNLSNIRCILPCVDSQNSLLSQFYSTKGKTNLNYFVYRIKDDITFKELSKRWEIAIMKITMLRTYFAPTNNPQSAFAQVTLENINPPWLLREQTIDVNKAVSLALEDLKQTLLLDIKTIPYSLSFVKTEQNYNYFILVMHHAIFDERSLNQTLRIVDNALETKIHLPSHEAITKKILGYKLRSGESKDFWISQLDGFTPISFPNLCTNRHSGDARSMSSKLSSINLFKFKEICGKLNISIQTLAQLAWAKLLGSYCSEDCVTFGLILSGQTLTVDETDAIFPTLTTIPYSVELSGTVYSLLKDIQERNKGFLKYQYTPLSHIKRWLNLGGNETYFDSLLSVQVQDDDTPLGIFSDEIDSQSFLDNTLAIELRVLSSGSLIVLNSLDRSIPKQHAQIIVEQFDLLLNSMISHLDENVETLERFLPTTVLSVLPTEVQDYPCEIKLLHEFVEYFAHKSPSNLALEFASQIHINDYSSTKFTYHELNCRANQLARTLKAFKFDVGTIISVYFDKCIEAFIAILAILKVGCCFLALDVTAPLERIKFIVEDSSSGIIISSKDQLEKLQAGNLPVKILNASDPDVYDLNNENLIIDNLSENNLAYVLYTSGSTGKPKGCCLTHKNVVQTMMAFQRQFLGQWNPSSRFLSFASLHFDVSVLEQYFSWSTGMCLVAAPKNLILQDIPTAVRVLKITHIDLTPSLASILNPENAPYLQVFITGGEQIRPEVMEIWGDTGVLYNFWGPTELTIGASAYRKLPKNARTSNIGPPFPNCSTYIISRKTNLPVLLGGLGEICMGGNQVARGYLNMPKQTEEKFRLYDNFNDRIYYTGDLGRLLSDESLDFCGRADDQIKLRGQRIEIGEINSVLKASSERILDAYTFALDHRALHKTQLVSFVHIRGKKTTSLFDLDEGSMKIIQIIDEYCRSHLATYMVPTFLIPINWVPLTPTNKFDKKKVVEEFHKLTQNQLSKLYQNKKPQNSEEETCDPKVLQSIAKFLNLNTSDVKPSTSIFELGIDSISAVSLASTLRENGYLSASPVQLLNAVSISKISKALTNNVSNKKVGDFPTKIKSYQGFEYGKFAETIIPCLPLVEGLLFELERVDRSLYFNTFTFKFRYKEEAISFIDALKVVTNKCEVLRSSFIKSEEGYFQIIWKPELLDKVGQLNVNNCVSPVNTFTKYTKGNYHVILELFHGVYDGWSLDLLLNDLAKIIQSGELSERPSYSSAVVEILKQSLDLDHTSFWSKLFRNRVSRLPQFSGELPEPMIFSRTISLSYLRLKSICRSSFKTSVSSIFLTAWLCFLNSHFLINTIGIVASGRSNHICHLDVIGPLFNTLPFPFFVESEVSFQELVNSTQSVLSSMIPFHHTPLRELKKSLQAKDLFNVLFVYTQHEKDLSDRSTSWDMEVNSTGTEFPLAFEVEKLKDDTLLINLATSYKYMENLETSSLLSMFEDFFLSVINEPKVVIQPQEATSVNQKILVEHEIPEHWNPILQTIIDIISEKVKVSVEDFRKNTYIYELGVDSIDLIWLSSRFSNAGLSKIDLNRFMNDPSLFNLLKFMYEDTVTCEHLSTLDIEENGSVNEMETALNVEGLEDCYMTTHLQRGLLMETLNDSALYQNSAIFHVNTSIDIERLKEAWITMIKCNPILRTNFKLTDINGSLTVVQAVEDASTFDYNSHIIRENIYFDGLEDAKKYLKSERDSPNPFETCPYRITFINVKDDHYMLVEMHHALYDGWSLSLMYDELLCRYNGRNVTIRKPFRKFVELVNDTDFDLEFWTTYLRNLSITRPLKLLKTEGRHSRGTYSSVSYSKLLSASKVFGVSVQSLIFCAWGIYLSRLYHSSDIIFHTVFSGRTKFEGADSILGPCMNTIPVRVKVEEQNKMLKQLTRELIQLWNHQHTPLSLIHSKCPLLQNLTVDSIFVYQRLPKRDNDSNVLKSIDESTGINYPIAMEFTNTESQLEWFASVDTSYVPYQEAEKMVDQVDEILNHIVNGKLAADTPKLPDVLSFRGYKISYTDYREALLDANSSNEGCRLVLLDDQTSLLFVPFGEASNQISLLLTDSMKRSLKKIAKNCRTKLPLFLMPSFLIPVTGIPKLPEEKVQTELVELFNSLSEEDIGSLKGIFELHDARLESVLTQNLSSVLNIPKQFINRSATFMESGMDSVHAIKYSSLLRNSGIPVTVPNILQNPSVEFLAHYILFELEDFTNEDTVMDFSNLYDLVSENSSISKTDVADVLPCSPGQLYALNAWYNTRKLKYFTTFLYLTDRIVQIERLKAAWLKLVKSADILRTTFVKSSDKNIQILQVLTHDGNVPWQHHIETQKNIETTSLAITEEEISSNTTFHEMPLRIKSVEVEGKLLLCISIHHALYDGWSINILLERLSQLYDDPDLELSDEDSKSIVSAMYSSNTAAATKRFWSDHLVDCQPCVLPKELGDSSNEDIYLYLPSVFDANSLSKKAQSMNVSLQSIAFAAFACVLNRWTKQSNLTFGVYVSGRSLNIPNAESVLYPLFNVIPLNIHMGISSRSTLVKEIQHFIIQTSGTVQQFSVKDHPKHGLVDITINFLSGTRASESSMFTQYHLKTKPHLNKSCRIAESTIDGCEVLNSTAPKLDFELAVRDGRLDMGIFTHSSIMSENNSKKFVTEFLTALEYF
ncbi:ferrichrome synthetase Sib1 [Schizosaccharomyces cryophilus OY26]|uniref:Ferrichrome synthetase Sib1 n=1 Tax=Schizosaccharomyces cryophilus (strain OY26 / ATCC MYA-4695 / CBS 11777 / NBRC 106824 / NRRL Y48691) TaxID=653667 RepID=S9W653_SCHCR|nr:ferrichrome synthetase Sib1 [Schizosaccharomyces cryophilus OY26]EPY54044.1 ferrichrome synthetase Sib1 [Schizosaccharomyces cryophilus OY26]